MDDEELRYSLRHLKVTAYAQGKPYNVNLATVIQKDDIDALMSLIEVDRHHHIALARIDENQIRLDRINNFKPQPGQLTSASFGRAGAGMEVASLKRSLEERIAEIEKSMEGKE